MTDSAELSRSLNDDAGFLASFVESDRLEKRWRCSRRYLRNLEHSGKLPKARMILGELRYRLIDIQKAERAWLADPNAETPEQSEDRVRLVWAAFDAAVSPLDEHHEKLRLLMRARLEDRIPAKPERVPQYVDGWRKLLGQADARHAAAERRRDSANHAVIERVLSPTAEPGEAEGGAA